jgi:hypothetical protein
LKPLIVLDPGHGDTRLTNGKRTPGYDPGVVSSSGRHEAEAALEMALTCKHELQLAGWDVLLTRDGTRGAKPDMARRVRYAHEVGALALISLHYNSEDTYPCVYYAPGWASLNLARRLAGVTRIPDDKVWESAHSRFRGLYIDTFRDDRPAILWECASINAAPPAGARGKELRKSLALKLVKAVEYLR